LRLSENEFVRTGDYESRSFVIKNSFGDGEKKTIQQKRAELKAKTMLERKEFNGRILITGAKTVS